MKVRISNIQRFCLHDGPGIRTTIFFKGCNLKCPWCCNPENMDYEIKEFEEEGIVKKWGYDIEIKDLYKEIMKDKDYYQNEGGITLSGGEALLQITKYEELLKMLKKEKINICLETSLAVPEKNVEIAMKYIDDYFVDVKILLKKEAQNILNLNIDLYQHNLDLLIKNNKNITLRFPVNKEYTSKQKNIELIGKVLKENASLKIEIFKTHNLGESKYQKLNKQYQKILEISDQELEAIYKALKRYTQNVKIIEM